MAFSLLSYLHCEVVCFGRDYSGADGLVPIKLDDVVSVLNATSSAIT